MTIMVKSLEAEFFTKEQIIEWKEKELKLSKKTLIYDRKAEKAFKESCESFFEYVEDEDSSSSSGSDSGSDSEEEEKVELTEEQVIKLEKETEQKKKQAEIIAKQQVD